MGIAIKIIWFLGLLVFVSAFAILSVSVVSLSQFLALGMMTGLVFFLAFLAIRNFKHSGSTIYHTAFQHLGSTCEVNLFHQDGHILLSTRPGHYLHLADFTRKLLQKIKPGPDALKLQNAIENFQSFEGLVSSSSSTSGHVEVWYIARVIPHKRHLSVTLLDVSDHVGNIVQIKQSYAALEKFIDSAPFGLYYTSRSGHLIGLNATLANWFGQLKEELIGKRISDVLTQTDDNWITLKTSSPLKLYHILNGAANLVFRMTHTAGLAGHADKDNTFEKEVIPAIKINRAGHIIKSNSSFRRLLIEYLDISSAEIFMDIVAENQRKDVTNRLHRIFDSTHAQQPFEVRFYEDRLHTTAYPSRIDKDNIIIQLIDISEQKRLEQQFIQSQKMQAVGQLAGGIAHDFNNLLTAMLGFCDLLLQRYIPSDASYNDVMHIKQNATRAANLVKQLLAFSRQQTLQPKVIHVTDTLSELTALLRRLIGAGIDLQMIHGRELWAIKVDASQLEQVIINLVVNARDAMGQKGKLILQTENYHSSKIVRLGHDIMPKGDYVLISVKDTGHGIAPEHIERIFDPFFSTKEVGEGTGLGLSTVYGIVKQTGGFIAVESSQREPSGTTFKIYLPRLREEETALPAVKYEPPARDLSGGGTILLVEDEDAVRLFSARALRDKGYEVFEAPSGEDALKLVQSGQKFDLLITDVVMPKMDGPTLAQKVQEYQKGLKTIFISGYTEDTFRKNVGHNAKIHFLAKPFSLKELASKVKDILVS